MKAYLLVGAFMVSSAFADLPVGNVTLTDPATIAKTLGSTHAELESVACVTGMMSNPEFKAYISVGYPVRSLLLSRHYDSTVQKNYVRASADFGIGQISYSCNLK